MLWAEGGYITEYTPFLHEKYSFRTNPLIYEGPFIGEYMEITNTTAEDVSEDNAESAPLTSARLAELWEARESEGSDDAVSDEVKNNDTDAGDDDDVPLTLVDLVDSDDTTETQEAEVAPTTDDSGQSPDMAEIASSLGLSKEASVEDILQAIGSATMLRSDYDRKRGQEAKQLREAQEAVEFYELVTADPDKLLEIAMDVLDDPDGDMLRSMSAARKAEAASDKTSDEPTKATDASTADIDKLIEDRVNAALAAAGVEDVKAWNAEREAKAALEAVDAAFNELNPDLSEKERNAVLAYAERMGLTTVAQLPVAYRAMKYELEERNNARQAARKGAPSGSGRKISQTSKTMDPRATRNVFNKSQSSKDAAQRAAFERAIERLSQA